jgi:hypothetical protein
MKLDSKYFDMIRIHRPKADKRDANGELPCCQWKGCTEPGRFRAPKGRGREGHYLFCDEHIRRYNSSYNYFEGMSEAEIEQYLQGVVYGHRPTWKVGINAWSKGGRRASAEDIRRFAEARASAQGYYAWPAGQQQEYRRALKPLERKALQTLDLPESASSAEIKARYKALVKMHHPDANGGHRGSEDRLREIIQAYNYLKQAGLV